MYCDFNSWVQKYSEEKILYQQLLINIYQRSWFEKTVDYFTISILNEFWDLLMNI